jgi:hypothetical protein
MTLYIEGQDTRVEVELWCPVCQPERDPILEVISPRLCLRHRDAEIEEITHNADDAAVTSTLYLSGSADAGGEMNRAVCDGIHRGRWPERSRS